MTKNIPWFVLIFLIAFSYFMSLSDQSFRMGVLIVLGIIAYDLKIIYEQD